MKRLIRLLLGLWVTVVAAQAPTDTIVLHQGDFRVTWSHSAKYPVRVVWKLTPDMLDCPAPLKRCDCFKSDPKLPGESALKNDYAGSGYDRGHNFNAADGACQTKEVNERCWYFTNMTPQTPDLNQRTWKELEEQCRKWVREGDELLIKCGSFGCVKKIGANKVWVPKYCWKIIYHKNGVVDAFLMPNTRDVDEHDFFYYHTDITVIRQKTGLKGL